MNDSMVDRLDDQEPVTITEALEIAQPRAVGSPLPRGIGNRVSLPPNYADLEDRSPVPHPGPVLAPPPSNFSFAGSIMAAGQAVVSTPEPAPAPVPVSVQAVPVPAHQPAVQQAAPAAPQAAPVAAAPERPRALQSRPAEGPSTLQRAAGVLRQALPIVQRLLPLLDGNIGAVVSNLLNPAPPPEPSVALAPPAPPRIDLTPIKENIAELQVMHVELREQIAGQSTSLKRVEDHLELVREATDRNTLEQQELMQDLKSMRSKVNVVAAIAIGLLAISLLVNMALYMHIQRVLP